MARCDVGVYRRVGDWPRTDQKLQHGERLLYALMGTARRHVFDQRLCWCDRGDVQRDQEAGGRVRKAALYTTTTHLSSLPPLTPLTTTLPPSLPSG